MPPHARRWRRSDSFMMTARKQSAVVLCYHDVVNQVSTASGMQSPGSLLYKMRRSDFAAHLDAIGRAGLTPTLPNTNGQLTSENSLVLTFDDGGISAISEIAPLLESRGWRGAFFITTDWIGMPGFLHAADIAALADRGHLIGSHSRSHPQISRLSSAQMREEWQESIRILSEIVGSHVVTASVPGGFYSQQVARAASDAGCRLLFNSEPVVQLEEQNGCLVAGRFRVVANTTTKTIVGLAQRRRAPQLRQQLSWEAKKAAKRFGGALWFRLRNRLRPN